jgi:AAHS family 3-hydroxyphenylpropionic acid transporter
MATTTAIADIPAAKGTSFKVVFLCFLGSLMEGIDIQSMGVAAPKVGPEFMLAPDQIGFVLTASIFGLMLGAAGGGWLADRIGRRLVLIASIAALGVFSLLTTVTSDFTSLLIVRVLCGVGMGGAFPNLIAMTAESSSAKFRSTAISLMYCGMPVGGAIVSLIAAGLAPDVWRPIFYVGGVGPLILVPIMFLFLPESTQFKAKDAQHDALEAAHSPAAARPNLGKVLFGEGRATTSIQLWIAFFFTLVVVYILLNWLPTLIGQKGFSKPQGSMASLVFNLGAIVGSVSLGMLMDRGKTRPALLAVYIGLVFSLAALAYLQDFTLVLAAAFFAGVFALGGQLALYALAPQCYPTLIRGAGVGSAIAVGRLGSMTGPIVTGSLLKAGLGAPAVISAAIPGLVISCIAAILLAGRLKSAPKSVQD